MRHLLAILVLLINLPAYVVGVPAYAVGVDEQVLPNPAQETIARAIMKDLRCLVCQNQSIDESNADMAADLRGVVRERVAAGDTAAEVHDYMVIRYGDWILMRPPVNKATWLLWFMPALLIALGLLAARSLMRRNRQAGVEEEPPLTAEEQAALDAALDQRDDV